MKDITKQILEDLNNGESRITSIHLNDEDRQRLKGLFSKASDLSTRLYSLASIPIHRCKEQSHYEIEKCEKLDKKLAYMKNYIESLDQVNNDEPTTNGKNFTVGMVGHGKPDNFSIALLMTKINHRFMKQLDKAVIAAAQEQREGFGLVYKDPHDIEFNGFKCISLREGVAFEDVKHLIAIAADPEPIVIKEFAKLPDYDQEEIIVQNNSKYIPGPNKQPWKRQRGTQ